MVRIFVFLSSKYIERIKIFQKIMGNDICSQVSTYCGPIEETKMAIYEYPIAQPRARAKQIHLPELTQEVKSVLSLKEEYEVDFIQKQCYIKKKCFGDDIYEGELNTNGVPHGIGKMYKYDGSLFVGKFVQGKAEGQGLYILNDGAYFEGKLVNNKAQCQNGKYVNVFFTYQGKFKDNVFHGEGKEYSKTHTFVGVYDNGRKSFGQLKWWQQNGQKDEYCYYGKFDENEDFTSQGNLKQPTGEYKGNFLKGKKHGEGVYLYKSNIKYEGQYVNGIKQGKGKVILANTDEVIYEGGFKNGLPDGQGLKYDENGGKTQTFYKDGINILTLLDPQSV